MSLQIVEKSGEGLSKVYGVTVPAIELTEKLEAKIAEITPRLNLKGFRPGKVPPAHIRRIYGKSLMGEVVEQTLSESTQQALDENKLRPAGQPDLKLESDIEQVLAGKADLAYELAVEVIPEFEPLDVSTLKLKRPVYEPAAAEVDEAMKDLALQNRTYEPRTGKTVKAKDGDMVVTDFIGRIDGEAFEGGSATDAQLVLGSGQFIPGFEEQLVGAKPGGKVTVKVSFPEDYGVESLKGKAAEFEVDVKEVRAPVESPADDEFAKKLGMADLEALKAALKGQLKTRYDSMSRFKLKRALLDQLDTKHDFPLPPRMVDAEFEGIWSQVQSENQQQGPSEEDKDKTEEQLRTEYRKIAERRVRLGLVLAELGRTHKIELTEQEVLQAAREEAMRYQGQEQQVFDAIRQNPQMMAQLRAPLYEDKVVEKVFELAKVTDQKVSKEKLLEEDELPAGYGG
ncbi:MAG TPA: trigger factor [Caulobacteraceae bacterium]